MPRVALLARESSNRVYGRVAPDLLVAELDAVSAALHTTVRDAGRVDLGGVPYVVADVADAHLDGHDRFVLSNLSGAHALFELRDDETLRPLPVTPLAWFDDDLVTIQRYPGKTNEQFTHLLLNVTVAESTTARARADSGDRVQVLDPVAGRGSTLNRALVHGFDATGIELAESDVDQYRTFVTTYLQEHRVKHRVRRETVRKGPLAGTSRFGVTIRGAQDVELVRGDTTRAAELLAGRRFDVVAGDLPYGVQHRAAGAKPAARSPEELLEAALTGWRKLMRRGASIGLSWNVRTMPRRSVEDLLDDAGFERIRHRHSFEHVVDRSITRDLVVARR